MSRYLRESAVESYIKAYLSKLSKTNNLRRDRPYIDKAIKMIETFLSKPCCDDDTFTISFSGRENTLTRYLHANLRESFDLRKHRKSLERAKTLLEDKLNDPCCDVDVEVQWSNALPVNHQVTFTDEYSNAFTTTLVGAGPQTITLPNRNYKVCVEVLIDLGGTFELTKDTVLVVGGGSSTATYCPITFDPLGSIYLVTFVADEPRMLLEGGDDMLTEGGDNILIE